MMELISKSKTITAHYPDVSQGCDAFFTKYNAFFTKHKEWDFRLSRNCLGIFEVPSCYIVVAFQSVVFSLYFLESNSSVYSNLYSNNFQGTRRYEFDQQQLVSTLCWSRILLCVAFFSMCFFLCSRHAC